MHFFNIFILGYTVVAVNAVTHSYVSLPYSTACISRVTNSYPIQQHAGLHHHSTYNRQKVIKAERALRLL